MKLFVLFFLGGGFLLLSSFSNKKTKPLAGHIPSIHWPITKDTSNPNPTTSLLELTLNHCNYGPHISPRAAKLLKNGPIRGFTLGLHSKDLNYDYDSLLQEIKTTGSPWVSITFTVFQDSNNSSAIHILPLEDPFWRRVETTVLQAKKLGLKVVLFPIVNIKYPQLGTWRGTLRPTNKAAWYQSYQELMTLVAKMAARTKVEMLSIGSEFSSLDRDKDSWSAVIKTIKKNYQGALMYSVNWDALANVEFHHHLDFLGMTGYFNLTRKKDPSIQELIAAWRPIREQFKQWQRQKNIPLLFSELGYTSQDGTNQHPWNFLIPNVSDMQEQKDCYKAFLEVWKEEELFGVIFYEWFGVGGEKDFGYTPRGKPALEVAKQWFELFVKQDQ